MRSLDCRRPPSFLPQEFVSAISKELPQNEKFLVAVQCFL